jgi:hypothetical protein
MTSNCDKRRLTAKQDKRRSRINGEARSMKRQVFQKQRTTKKIGSTLHCGLKQESKVAKMRSKRMEWRSWPAKEHRPRQWRRQEQCRHNNAVGVHKATSIAISHQAVVEGSGKGITSRGWIDMGLRRSSTQSKIPVWGYPSKPLNARCQVCTTLRGSLY